MQIRPYRVEELPAIVRCGVQTARAQLVERDVPGATWDGVASQLYRMYQVALQVPEATVLVADLTGEKSLGGPAGHVLLMPQPNPFTGEREMVVLDIFTHPAARGTGLGRRLLQSAEAYAKSTGCASLTAQVALHNQSSLRLFRRAAYASERVVVGKRIPY